MPPFGRFVYVPKDASKLSKRLVWSVMIRPFTTLLCTHRTCTKIMNTQKDICAAKSAAASLKSMQTIEIHPIDCAPTPASTTPREVTPYRLNGQPRERLWSLACTYISLVRRIKREVTRAEYELATLMLYNKCAINWTTRAPQSMQGGSRIACVDNPEKTDYSRWKFAHTCFISQS